MEINAIKYFSIVLLLHFVLNEPIELKNFGKYVVTKENEKFFYNFQPNTSIIYEGSHYFFFGIFGSSSCSIYIFEENQSSFTTKIEINSDNKFYGYEISNLTAQKYTFEISPWSTANLIFIDNSKEIDTNLTEFLNFNFET